MPRPRLPRDEQGNIIRPKPPDVPAPPVVPNPPTVPTGDDTPPRVVNGRPNPLYYAHLVSEANSAAREKVRNNEALNYNHDGYLKGVMTEAKMAGVDIESIADHRTERQQLAEALERYAETPEAVWEDTDAELKAVLAGMDKSEEMICEYVEGRFKTLASGSDISGKLKGLRTRIETVLSLRQRARNPLPTGSYNRNAHQIKAAHLLRFMLYVGRSNIHAGTPGGTVFKIGRHHAKMAWDIYEAENGIEMTWDDKELKGVVTVGRIPYVGIEIVCPIGHGKSELATHFTARAICLNPELQAVMLHAVAAEAEKNLRYVSSCFDRTNSVGRRCMSLFPIELETSTNKRMKVKLGRPLKQSTLEAYGFMSGRLGINTGLQVWDDIVPQSDVTEETTRKRRFDRMGGTWLTRQRGTKTFVLNICTLWHHDDVNSRLIRLAKSKSNPVMFRISKQACGGPKDRPMFYPLWPEMYGQDFLKQKFAIMGPALFSAAYQSNPISAEGRIVKELRLYDPAAPEHREFLSRAVHYLSLDPSGVNRKKADKAGFVYGASGEVSVIADGMQTSRQFLRILAAKQFNATQTDLVEYACGFAQNNRTDYVLAEQQGLSAIVDIFRVYHSIDVIPITPGNKDKETRLRRVAGMLDESQVRVGGPHAVVEFPGIKDAGGRLVLDPDFKELAEQILDFGVAANDGLLDATTQLAYHLMPDLRPGLGAVSQSVKQAAPQTEWARRKLAMLKSMQEDNNKSAAEVDYAWSCNWNRG